MNTTEEWIQLLEQLGQRRLPTEVLRMVQGCLMDYLGCAYYGAFINRQKIRPMTENPSVEIGRATLLGYGRKVSAGTAAMVNGFNAHTAELDDGHRKAMLHLGSVIVSAMLAVCQENQLTAEQFIRGMVMGYEASIRLGQAVQPGHKLKGFLATGTCGTVGTAVGLALCKRDVVRPGPPIFRTVFTLNLIIRCSV